MALAGIVATALVGIVGILAPVWTARNERRARERAERIDVKRQAYVKLFDASGWFSDAIREILRPASNAPPSTGHEELARRLEAAHTKFNSGAHRPRRSAVASST